LSYNILAVRGTGEPDDSRLYPVPGEAPDTVEPISEDQEPLRPLTATELVVSEIAAGGRRRQIIRVSKMRAKVIVTEARVVVACSKYEKGGGWTAFSLGAIPVTMAANTVSKVRAARRRQGKMLVGHVRYVQLASVGFKPPSGLKQRDTLRLGTFDHTAEDFRGLTLDITLAGGQQSASELAQLIAHWAVDHEMENGKEQMDGERRELLEAIRKSGPLVPQAKKFSSYFLSVVGTSGLDAALEAT
jgi:hypothetical protein